jgi:hypothetical protein
MTKYVVPKEGLLVRHPVTKTPLPPAGAEVEWQGREGTYWKRRVKDGSVTISAPAIVKTTVPAEATAEAKPEKKGKRRY